MATDKDNEKIVVSHQETLTPSATLDYDYPAKDVEGEADVDYSGAHKKTDPAEIALVKKLDKYIMPTLWIMYWLNYLDRNAIALAKIGSIMEDTGISDVQYQTCVSILFVGYILGQVPSNMLITRLRPSIYMSSCMALWAIVSGLTALANDFKGLFLTRFFLGLVEAPYYPGALYILGIFYTRKEIATRISILYTGNILATAFAGLIAIGIFKLDGTAGLSDWRWLFLIQGIATLVVAIGAGFVLPDDPLTTRWLTPEERLLANGRITRDTVGASAGTSSWAGLKAAAADPKLWLFAAMQHMHLAANGFKNFFPTAVESLGFDNQDVTLALTCPPYLIAGATSIYWSWQSGRYNERTWHITSAKALAVVGFVLAGTISNVGGRYFSMCVFAIGTYAVNSIILGWVSATCGQTKEKKASSLAIVNTIANVSFIWTPYLWPDSDEPNYPIAMGSSAGFSVITAGLAWVMKFWLMRINRRMRQSEDERSLAFAY
ncbi:unnamed protein product [Zymoseptoria tritici ST99CH_1E4]|uniref:Major facilitator superfamily (MFS) profile domain-containing protein n=1 Tax=Zymoseptoria tritici ST99CH_1E4 TaxID=1276532 RepID=A0A2H1H3M2_ZYMTR|nr:unnamed protein product [Zymoseptoria tritici ST99CH_1E4]